MPRCKATSKNTGKQCGLYAIKGATVCKYHGANTATRKKAAVAVAKMEAMKLGIPLEIDPALALLTQVWEAAGNVAFYREQVQDEDPVIRNGAQLRYDAERDRLVKVAALCIQAGVAERQVRIAEQQGQMIGALLMRVVTNPLLDLEPRRMETAKQIIAIELKEISAKLGG